MKLTKYRLRKILNNTNNKQTRRKFSTNKKIEHNHLTFRKKTFNIKKSTLKRIPS